MKPLVFSKSTSPNIANSLQLSPSDSFVALDEELHWIMGILDGNSSEDDVPRSKINNLAETADSMKKALDRLEQLNAKTEADPWLKPALPPLPTFKRTPRKQVFDNAEDWQKKYQQLQAKYSTLETKAELMEKELTNVVQVLEDYESQLSTLRDTNIVLEKRVSEGEKLENDLQNAVGMLEEYEKREAQLQSELDQQKQRVIQVQESASKQALNQLVDDETRRHLEQIQREIHVKLDHCKQLLHFKKAPSPKPLDKTNSEKLDDRQLLRSSLTILGLSSDLETTAHKIRNILLHHDKSLETAHKERDEYQQIYEKLHLEHHQQTQEYLQAVGQWEELVNVEEAWLLEYENQWRRICLALPEHAELIADKSQLPEVMPDSAATVTPGTVAAPPPPLQHPLPFETILAHVHTVNVGSMMQLRKVQQSKVDTTHLSSALSARLERALETISDLEEEQMIYKMREQQWEEERGELTRALQTAESKRKHLKEQLSKVKEAWNVVYGKM